MKKSTKEQIDKTIEHICDSIQNYNEPALFEDAFSDSVRALAALVSARAQIED